MEKKLEKQVKKAENKLNTKLRNEIVPIMNNMELSIVEKKRQELPKYIRKRKKAFLQECKEFGELIKDSEDDFYTINNKKFDAMELIDHTFEPIIKNTTGIAPTYSANNLSIALDYYRECVNELNKVTVYPPSKEDFCRLLGISVSLFNTYSNSSSSEMREICNQINDYFNSVLSRQSMLNKLEPRSTQFYQKAVLKLRDNDPVQINTYTQNNTVLSNDDIYKIASKFQKQLNNIEIDE